MFLYILFQIEGICWINVQVVHPQCNVWILQFTVQIILIKRIYYLTALNPFSIVQFSNKTHLWIDFFHHLSDTKWLFPVEPRVTEDESPWMIGWQSLLRKHSFRTLTYSAPVADLVWWLIFFQLVWHLSSPVNRCARLTDWGEWSSRLTALICHSVHEVRT